MITINLRYTGKGNAALDFAKEMTESGTVAKIRALLKWVVWINCTL